METQLLYQGCAWYYVTREGDKRGPFNTEKEAEQKARAYFTGALEQEAKVTPSERTQVEMFAANYVEGSEQIMGLASWIVTGIEKYRLSDLKRRVL